MIPHIRKKGVRERFLRGDKPPRKGLFTSD
jgi:hypothetical protein